MGYSTKHLANLFQVSRETIRTWSGEFGDYLSTEATPSKGKTRQFNDDDIAVFALVAQMRDARLGVEDIKAMLANGQRGEVPEDASMLISNYDERRVEALESQIRDLRMQLIDARQERDIALAKIEGYKERIEELREEAQQARSEARDHVGDMQGQVAQLQREIGRLIASLEVERERGLGKDND